MTLQNVQVGEPVMLIGCDGSLSVKLIAKVTKLHIILEKGGKFQRATGRQVNGDIWHSQNIEVLTPQNLASVKAYRAEFHRRRLATDLRQFQFCDLTTDQLNRISAITKEPRP